MLTVSDLTKGFAGRVLFREVSLQVNREDRIGLVGPNGAGKSTLFSLILGAQQADAGSISLEKNARVGYLSQETVSACNETVLQLATTLTQGIGDGSLSPGISAPQKVFKGAIELDSNHDHHLEAKAKKVLTGLGFRQTDFNRPSTEMSGGWVMRAHLARLLVHEPDLLMLDEPTNHLDLDALLWFQAYLKSYRGGILLISHDREFLNQTVSGIVEIRQSRLIRYRGNYEDYVQQRAANEEQHLAAYKNQQREIARLMHFVDRFRAKNTKASQAQSKLKQIERMEKIDSAANDEYRIAFRFPQPKRSGLKVIGLTDIDHAYGSHVVYRGLNFRADRGQRIVLVGPNGAGKSTLLKILAGVVEFKSGQRLLGHNTKAGYYSQYRVETLRLERTVLEEALDTPQSITEESARTVLGCFLFRGDDVFKRVSVLSGGEKSRLALVKLLLDPPNLLLMDEPTTHLDMPSTETLIESLRQFEGTIIFISHDVYFIRELANHVVHVNEGRLTHFPGDYQYYLDKTSATAGVTASPSATQSGNRVSDGPRARSREQKRLEAEQRQARSRERKAQMQIVQELEREIDSLEQMQASLTNELERPETYQKPGRPAELNRELSHVTETLNRFSKEWELEATKLAALEDQ